MPPVNSLFSKPFQSLSQKERLFLYAIRHWGRAQRAACPGDSKRPSPFGERTKVDKQLDVFLRGFAQALPEPFLLKPTQCRCDVIFHEATLLDVFSAMCRQDRSAAICALQDLLPQDVCERLMIYLMPLVSEIDLAVEVLCHPSVPTLPLSKL